MALLPTSKRPTAPIRTAEIGRTGPHSPTSWQPIRPPLAAVESVRTKQINRAVFGHAKIVQTMDGYAQVETALGACELRPGLAMVVGAGVWCTIRPRPRVRMWTLYLDEEFLRSHMRWVLTDASRVRPGLHPDAWDGTPLLLNHGLDSLRKTEPVLRQISVVDETVSPEVAATRLIGLFAQFVEITLPDLLVDPDTAVTLVYERARYPVQGTLTAPAFTKQLQQALDRLHDSLSQSWSVPQLAREVAMSHAHLTREFNRHVGLAPMRYLTEIRLTEFTRLLEETDLPLSSAARQVGWQDSRIAAGWFRKRFGINPSEYRAHPHPSCTGIARCESCRGVCALSEATNTRNAP